MGINMTDQQKLPVSRRECTLAGGWAGLLLISPGTLLADEMSGASTVEPQPLFCPRQTRY